ncbi:MAG: response regulator [Longimicrobiales bacterium]
MRTGKRILVLDDEPIVGDRMKPALEKLGFHVEAFTESQAAVQRMVEADFDVLVTDLKMQKPDGLEVMDFVKQHSPSTKVVIITGFATVDTAVETMKGGAVDFIAKPFKIRDLCNLIVKLTSEEAP